MCHTTQAGIANLKSLLKRSQLLSCYSWVPLEYLWVFLQIHLPAGTSPIAIKGREVRFRITEDPAVPSAGARQELKQMVIHHIRIGMNLPPSPQVLNIPSHTGCWTGFEVCVTNSLSRWEVEWKAFSKKVMGLFARFNVSYNHSLKLSSPRFPIPNSITPSTLVTLTAPFL